MHQSTSTPEQQCLLHKRPRLSKWNLKLIFNFVDCKSQYTIHNIQMVKIVYADGVQEWRRRDGRLHRIHGPARIYANGDQEWWQYGQRHRDDGPAFIRYDTQQWWKNGNLHRIDGPAVIKANGFKAWFKNGRRHRIDGPAVIKADGKEQWWKNGRQYTGPKFLFTKEKVYVRRKHAH